MNKEGRIFGTSAVIWAVLTFLAWVMLLFTGLGRNSDIYDITEGLNMLTSQPVLLSGAHVVFAWSGVALVLIVIGFYTYLPGDVQPYLRQVGGAFGLIAGATFLLYGLVGGFGYADLSYIESVRSVDYIREAYLPLTLITNRILGMAIAIWGLWMASTNWLAMDLKALPGPVSLLGLGAGMSALVGLMMPAGLLGLLGLLLGIVWAFLVGLFVLRSKSLLVDGN